LHSILVERIGGDEKSPLFILNRLKDKVAQLIADAIKGTDIFLVQLKVNANNDINVLLDSDSILTLKDCRRVSRAIEFNLDREEEDFSLTTSSSGVGEPLVLRQFAKNIGRKVRLTLKSDEVIEAKMIGSSDDSVSLEWKTREKKITGKGKITIVHHRTINHKDINQTVVLITF
jgi:ribosome maturation factor RimP